MSQSIHASTPSRIGEPDPAGRHDSSANLSPPFIAKTRQTDSCSAPRMLTQKAPESRNFGQLDDDRSGMNATSGGASDTDENEATPTPAGAPSPALPGPPTTPRGERTRNARDRP